ncbi:MAG: hypothetical protein ACI311_05830 [Bacilli bacterium]
MEEQNVKQKNNELLNKLCKLQRPLMLGLLFVAVALLIYSFIFMSPFYDMYILDGRFLLSNLENWGIDYTTLPEESYLYKGDSTKVIGISITYFTNFTREGGMQAFNHAIFTLGIIGILLVGVLYIYRSQLRKRYYATNFVVIGIVCAFFLGTSIYMLIELLHWFSYVKDINYEIINYYYCDMYLLTEYTEVFSAATSKWVFVVGFVLTGIIILSVILTVVFTAIKARTQKLAGKIDTSGVVIND